MDTEVVLVLVPEGGDPVIPGPDGNPLLPRHQDESCRAPVRGEERLIRSSPRDLGRKPGTGTTTLRCRRGRASCSPAIPTRRSCSIPAPTTARIIRRGEVSTDAGGRFRPERPASCHDAGAAADLAGASQGNPDRTDRGARARIRGPQIRPRRLADAGDARRRGRTELDARRRSQRGVAGSSRCDRPRDRWRYPRRPRARRHAARRQFTQPSPCVPEFPSPPPSTASSISSSGKPDDKTQSPHFRRAVSRRRADLQGSRRRGRLPAQSRQGQGQARRDHRQLRRPCDPLRDQGDREDHRQGHEAEGDRPRRHRRRQCRDSRGDRQGHHRDEHAVRQFDHDRRARHHADAGAGARNSAGRRLDPGRQVGEEPLHGRRDHRQDAGRDRLRQYRLDRRRPRARPAA